MPTSTSFPRPRTRPGRHEEVTPCRHRHGADSRPAVADCAHLAALGRALDWLAGRTDGLLVVGLGIDASGLDPICDFAPSTSVYQEVGRPVVATGNRLVILQASGYRVPRLGENVRRWLRGAASLAAPEEAADAG
jgi:acetoin utilization deacetylase AcuC-like enzyme